MLVGRFYRAGQRQFGPTGLTFDTDPRADQGRGRTINSADEQTTNPLTTILLKIELNKTVEEDREMKSSTGRWVTGANLFDRTTELNLPEQRIREGNHVSLTGQRRMGKTSVARELGQRLETTG